MTQGQTESINPGFFKLGPKCGFFRVLSHFGSNQAELHSLLGRDQINPPPLSAESCMWIFPVGFLVNRLLGIYMSEAGQMLLQGADPVKVDGSSLGGQMSVKLSDMCGAVTTETTCHFRTENPRRIKFLPWERLCHAL